MTRWASPIFGLLLSAGLPALCSSTDVANSTVANSTVANSVPAPEIVSTPAIVSAPKVAHLSEMGASQGIRDRLAPTVQATERLAGFSPDGNHYLYLESSRDTGAGVPKSSLQLLQVAANACATNGCIETRYGEADSGLSLAAAEASLLQRTSALRQTLNLMSLATGRRLEIMSRQLDADGAEVVTVRLTDRDTLQLQLRQTAITSIIQGGTAERDRAAMQLEVTHNGHIQTIDSLDNYRDWVLNYSIREVRCSPDGQHLAVLVTATKPTFEGRLGTTIVQTFQLN